MFRFAITALVFSTMGFALDVPTGRCIIEQSACLQNPEFVGKFCDSYPPAKTQSNTCLQRAKEYSLWCANPLGVKTTATYIWPNDTKISASYIANGTACFIDQSVCSLYPQQVGHFQDSFENSDRNASRCARRARDYAQYCNNPKGALTTAAFIDQNGNSELTTFVSTGSGCLITQSYCLTNPSAVGSFTDAFDNSDKDANRCLLRAEEYALACGNKSGMATTARYTRSDGSSVESTYVVK